MTLEYELVCERAEGKLVGAYQKALETAKTALGLGLPKDTILKISGISKEDYERLSKE